ncbi:MAG: TOBE domain-containing protein [Rhodospirillales bacterium]
MLRPEKVRLCAPGTSPAAGEHAEPGTVSETQYLGMATRVTVTLEDGTKLLTTWQNMHADEATVVPHPPAQKCSRPGGARMLTLCRERGRVGDMVKEEVRLVGRAAPPGPRRYCAGIWFGGFAVVLAAAMGPLAAQEMTSVGTGEGELNIVAWEGYAQDDWAKPFEQQTGCKLHHKYAGSSDEMVALMRQGGGGLYDAVSASGDASLRLIFGHNVAPINIALIPAWNDFVPDLQSPSFNTVKACITASPTNGARTYCCGTRTK